MSIPLIVFYYGYLLLVVVYLFYTLFNTYHLVRFGYFSLAVPVVTIVYILVSVMIMIISWHYLGAIDWSQQLEVLPPLNRATLPL